MEARARGVWRQCNKYEVETSAFRISKSGFLLPSLMTTFLKKTFFRLQHDCYK